MEEYAIQPELERAWIPGGTRFAYILADEGLDGAPT